MIVYIASIISAAFVVIASIHVVVRPPKRSSMDVVRVRVNLYII